MHPIACIVHCVSIIMKIMSWLFLHSIISDAKYILRDACMKHTILRKNAKYLKSKFIYNRILTMHEHLNGD